jgi:hypothetical protein
MLSIRRLQYFFLVVLLTTVGFCQNPSQVAPVPPDPLELVTGATQVPSTPQERAQVLELLERARQNGDLHAAGSQPFTLKVSFNAAGNVLFTGSGEMEETWFGPTGSRWTARLGDFSLVRILNNGRIFDDKAVDFIPMRVHMLRDTIFWPFNFNQAHALIRTATVNWKGKELTCILTSGGMSDPSATPGRRWVEREFCIETQTGLLQVLSDAPGVYVLFDYTNALKFHGRVLPRTFTIVEGGNTVLDARLESIADATSSPDSLTPTSEMKGHGPGPLLSGTIRWPRFVRVASGASTVQPVIVHAIVDREGRVVDAELVENSGTALSQTALDIVKQSTYPPDSAVSTREQREAFINVKFVSQ